LKKGLFLLIAAAASAAFAQTAPQSPPPLPPATTAAPAPEVTGTTRLTLSDALTRALSVNNTVERSRADIGLAEANRKLLLSNVLPRVNASGAATRNSTSASFGSAGQQTTILAQNDWNYRIVLSQPIYAGRREFRAYSQAKLGVLNAREAELGTEDAVLLRVASNYLGIVNADARIAIEQRNIDIAEQQRKQAQTFYEAGETTRVDVLRAETALKAAQRAFTLAQQVRENAVSRLRADLDLDTNIEAVPPERALPRLPGEAALVGRAETDRPDIVLAENNLRIAQLEIQKQHGYWLPTVTFDGGFIQQKSQFPAAKYSYGALRFNIPILQSGEVEARVAVAKEHELQARLDLDTARTSAREDVRTAASDLRSAEKTLAFAQEQLGAAEAEYAQVAELYRAQEATSLDVASAEASLADARRAVAEDTLNRNLSELRVWYAAGSLKLALDLVAPVNRSTAPAAPQASTTAIMSPTVANASTNGESGAVKK
jgi:outer membrane protein